MCVSGGALEQEDQPRHVVLLLDDQLARRHLAQLRDGEPLGELLVVDAVEQVDAAQLGERDRARGVMPRRGTGG